MRPIDADALKAKINTTFFSEIGKIIDNAPTVAEAVQGWIPCSEKLPHDNECVIVSVVDDHGDTPWSYTAVAWLCNGTWISDNDYLCGDAIAWMPLPEPYKGGEEGEGVQ